MQDGKVVGMVPDKKHPTNRGIQCIKGLNAHEPIYVDRLTKVPVRKDVCGELMKYGDSANVGAGPFFIDDMAAAAEQGRKSLLEIARDNALTPEFPDIDAYENQSLREHVENDKYPFWLSLGIVYEHFHTAKTIRGATTLKLVPEQYVEVSPKDAATFGLRDGQKVRLVTRRGSYEGRVSVGVSSMVRPARSEVFPGMLFSPWNLSVADTADPEKNKWLVNKTSHRAWDPISGQVDFKKLAATSNGTAHERQTRQPPRVLQERRRHVGHHGRLRCIGGCLCRR